MSRGSEMQTLKPMGINWIGLYTMVRREVQRMARVPIQAFVAPWISALLFIFIFGSVVGGRIALIGGHKYLEFVLPGILMLNIVTAASCNPPPRSISRASSNSWRRCWWRRSLMSR